MAASDSFAAFVIELLEPIGRVTVRRMFGGAGVYLDGVIFGLIADDTLFFKADETNRGDYEAESMPAFTYETKDGRNTLMSYWKVPERLFDEPEELAQWARKSVAISAHKPKKKAGRKRGSGQ